METSPARSSVRNPELGSPNSSSQRSVGQPERSSTKPPSPLPALGRQVTNGGRSGYAAMASTLNGRRSSEGWVINRLSGIDGNHVSVDGRSVADSIGVPSPVTTILRRPPQGTISADVWFDGYDSPGLSMRIKQTHLAAEQNTFVVRLNPAVCEICAVKKRRHGTPEAIVPFHLCVNDAVVVGFRTKAGPIEWPRRLHVTRPIEPDFSCIKK